MTSGPHERPRASYSTAGLPAAVKKARRRDAIFSAAAAGTQAAPPTTCAPARPAPITATPHALPLPRAAHGA